jgi:hypothetical protein
VKNTTGELIILKEELSLDGKPDCDKKKTDSKAYAALLENI